MFNDIDKELISNFLKRNYPIKRVKHNMRFRRGIIFDDGREYILGDESQHTTIRFKLIEVVKLIFYCEEHHSRELVNSFLKN